MSFFSKPEYKEFNLLFEYVDYPDDYEAGSISIESCVYIEGERKYCCASFVISQKDIDEMDDMIELIKNPHEKTVKVKLKFKDGKCKDFRFDLNSLAVAYNDERFRRMELTGWSLKDKPFKELIKN